jgi:hypothetical protein
MAQGTWQVTTLAEMPEGVSNNAVATNGTHVYSFMGIDSTKLFSGIHLRSFRYDIPNDVWDTIAPVPDNLSRIAAAASAVKGKIYVIGGYHVYSNGSEVSSNKVFIYDPGSNTYTSGADMPVPTDDHVQCVWRDSLIYVISGWSNSGNISDVQIYNPALDQWTAASALPIGAGYEAFGASGVIIDNTIYFSGGVTDTWVFSMIPKVRTGTINPSNPTTINWSVSDDTLAALYRSGAGVIQGLPIWFGGADKAYNYDGVEYGSGLGVEPLNRVTMYEPLISVMSAETGAIPAIMDMRGIAQIDSNKYIIAGGMGPGQQVSKSTYSLEYVVTPGIQTWNKEQNALVIYPNPASRELQIQINKGDALRHWSITGTKGVVVETGKTIPNQGLNISHLPAGLYALQITTSTTVYTGPFMVVK